MQELIFIAIYLFTVDEQSVTQLQTKKANYSQFDQGFLYLLRLHLKHSKSPVYFKY